MRAGVPVVPIALLGTEDTTPTLATLNLGNGDFPFTLNTLLFGPVLGPLLPFPAKIRARVLPPVYFDETPDQASYPRSVVMDRAEEVRSAMQAAITQMRTQRKSVWRG